MHGLAFVRVCFSLRRAEQCLEAEYVKIGLTALCFFFPLSSAHNSLTSERSCRLQPSIHSQKKEGSVASAFVSPAFDSVGECISLRVLCKPCMPPTYFHSQCNETLMCKSNFPCAPLESEGEKKWLSRAIWSKIPNTTFHKYTAQRSAKGYSATVLPAVHLTKLRLLVLGRKGHGGKSLWRSIRQFSVGSAADAQVIYSEGARTAWWRMLADILPCLPNFFLLQQFDLWGTIWHGPRYHGCAPSLCFHWEAEISNLK